MVSRSHNKSDETGGRPGVFNFHDKYDDDIPEATRMAFVGGKLDEAEMAEELKSRGIPQPCKPSAKEVEVHNRTRYPFRSW